MVGLKMAIRRCCLQFKEAVMEMFHDDEKVVQENNKLIKNENNRQLHLLFSVIFLMKMGKMKMKLTSTKEVFFFCV